MENTRICFIGCGNMGRSLIGGILGNGYDSTLLSAIDPDPVQRDRIAQQYGIELYPQPRDSLCNADVIVLAVKPQIMETAARSISAVLGRHRPLFLSIAAGIRLASLEGWLPREATVVRVMPNTPSQIRAGVAVLIGNLRVTATQKELAESIMRSVGTALWVEDESLMDVVTALSGSGPAYFFLLMEVLEQAAVGLGLGPEQARLLTMETALGAARMVMESDQHAGELRRQVTSPGGTTERALQVLDRGGLAGLFQQALTAARDRSIELSDAFGGEPG